MPTLIVAAELPELPELFELSELDDPELLPDGAAAAVPTEVTTPGVALPSGKTTATRAPGVTSGCWVASTWAVTCLVLEVACSTAAPGWAGVPSVADTLLTLSAVGRNTACPSGRLPV